MHNRPAAKERASGHDSFAPVVVSKFLIVRNLGVGSVKTHWNVTAHFVRSADKRQTITAVQVAIVFQMVNFGLSEHFDAVQTPRGNQRSRLTIGIREVGTDDVTTLSVSSVSPMSEGGLHVPTDFGLAGAVAAPRHHGRFQAPHDHVTHEVLAVLLGHVDDVVAVLLDRRRTSEVLGVGEQTPPLGLEQVYDVQVFSLGFGMRALSGQKMDVGVAAEPSSLVHVDPTFQSESKLLLAGFNAYTSPQRLVLKATRHVHDDITPGQPSLAGSVDVSVRNLAQTDVASNVDVPSAEVGVNLIVMPVRLIRNTLW